MLLNEENIGCEGKQPLWSGTIANNIRGKAYVYKKFQFQVSFVLKMMPSFRSFLMHRDGEVHYIGEPISFRHRLTVWGGGGFKKIWNQ